MLHWHASKLSSVERPGIIPSPLLTDCPSWDAQPKEPGSQLLTVRVPLLTSTTRRRDAADAAKAGDIVVVSVPLKNYRAVPIEPLAGKIVIDRLQNLTPIAPFLRRLQAVNASEVPSWVRRLRGRNVGRRTGYARAAVSSCRTGRHAGHPRELLLR